MNREEYNLLKAQAHELMVEDYKWLLGQESGSMRWRATKRWLIEFVHDVSDRLNPMDEWLRPVPLCKLYATMFERMGVELPPHPSKALSKLRAMEQRRRILPDSITLFYMREIGATGYHGALEDEHRIIRGLVYGSEETCNNL